MKLRPLLPVLGLLAGVACNLAGVYMIAGVAGVLVVGGAALAVLSLTVGT